MNRCSTSAIKLDRWPHKVMSIPRKRLDKEVAMSGHWRPTWAMDEKFQKLVGIPYRHVVAVIGFRKHNPEMFVDNVIIGKNIPFVMVLLCTKCDKFGHNIQSCKSKKQDPNALKRKKKVKDDAGNVNQIGNKAGTKTETDINTTHPAMQTATDINTTNLAMQTESDINTTSANKKGKSKVKQ
ncbi:hypothetical protein KIW84_071245 [Lathyrus oleraceus]|uniref:Uncharacterized protein n=1 Tax=Pisum sativum TaxID=3888 RepID=A0A9D4VHS3_PEA|nr:hypothetical protein KIW84_071245 [Pisum sativum]